MTWRWRRSIRGGPFNINMSKSGIGWSINLGLFRYGVNPQGRKYISTGIPGTGLYFIKYLDVKPRSVIYPNQQEPQQTPASQQPSTMISQSNNQSILDRIKAVRRKQP